MSDRKYITEKSPVTAITEDDSPINNPNESQGTSASCNLDNPIISQDFAYVNEIFTEAVV